MDILLGKNGGFYKANLHCHSVKSDGKMTVEELKEEYKRRGYSVVAFTDHDAVFSNKHLNDKDFLALTSFELGIKENALESTLVNHRMKCVHLNLYSLSEDNNVTPCYDPVYDKYKSKWSPEVRYEGVYERSFTPECINEIIKTAHERGFLVCLNHPSWSLLDATDYLKYEGFDMLEIVNFGCVQAGHADDENVLNTMAMHGRFPYPVAADDNHNLCGFDQPDTDSFGGFVMIDAPRLDYESIAAALRLGDFYASQGPKIYSIAKEERSVTVKCSAASSIFLCTDSRERKKATARVGESVTEATFELGSTYDKFRIVIVDEKGRKAYSRFYNVN